MAKDDLNKVETIADLIEDKLVAQKINSAKRAQVRLSFLDDAELNKSESEEEKDYPSLIKSVLNVVNQGTIQRISFTADPTSINNYGHIYIPKLRLIPDNILKRIPIQDDLVASIVQLRCNQAATFAVPRKDRFSPGYVIEANTGVIDSMKDKPDALMQFHQRIESATAKLNTCGETKGWNDLERCSFATWMRLSTRNALTVGRLATEILWVTDPATNKKKFHSFRAIDAGTIYRATDQTKAQQAVRDNAFNLLKQVTGRDDLLPERFAKNEYAWVQVIDNTPREVYTADECVVHNFYPVDDVELNGYPVTPIDTMISAVTTHMNITTHNKLYFQNGRAAKGMIVLNSDDVDQNVLNNIRHQFNASINSLSNSHRLPVFGIPIGEEINWVPMDNAKDMEFQYLSDMNARVIMTAFQVSPDELPGWSYLSKGTNSQALSESNIEFKIQAARDLGIRPLLAHFEDFLNTVILPLIDPSLAQLAKIRLVGLETDNAEKEAIRLQQNIPINMTYNLVMDKVEQDKIPKEMGGDFPFNPQFQEVLNNYVKVGKIQEFFLGIKGASEDPDLQYYRDNFWFQAQQLKQQAQQMQMQAQQPPGQDPNGGGDASEGPVDPDSQGGSPIDATEDGQPDVQGANGQGGEDNAPKGDANQQPDTEDLSRSIDQALGLLSKSEGMLPMSKRKALSRHKMTIKNFVRGLEDDLRAANKDILALVDKNIKN